MRSIVRIFLIVLVFATYNSNQYCPIPQSERSKILTDEFKVIQQNSIIQSNQNIEYEYTFAEQMNEKPKIIVGSTFFETDPSSVLGFSVSVLELTKTTSIFDVKLNSNGNWKQMRVNFISSTRSDIQLGFGEYNSQQGKQSQNFAIDYKFDNKELFTTAIHLIVKPLLSGILLKSNNFLTLDLRHSQMQYNQEGIIFYFSTNNTNVQFVKIDIIAFDAYNPSLRYADGSIAQNYLNSKVSLQIPAQNIGQLRTYIYGIISFDVSTSYPISLYASLSEKFILEIGPQNDQCQLNHITVNYLVLSIFDKCGACQGYIYEYDGKCVEQCPKGYKIRDGKCVQIKCSIGYYYQNEECTKCPQNSYVYIKQCNNACGQGFVRNEQKCQPICKNKMQVFFNNQCICINGMQRINGQCDYCEIGTKYDQKSQSCLSLCGQFSTFDVQKNKCVCDSGYNYIGGICQQFQGNLVYFEKQRRLESQCGQFQYFNGYECYCLRGYYKINGVCGKCPSDKIFENGQCRDRCPRNEVYVGQKCDCRNDHVRVNGICCKRCTADKIWNGQQCVCAEGYVVINGICRKCIGNEEYNSETNTCQCKEGFYRINGRCGICDYGYDYIAEKQYCKSRCAHNEVYLNEECVCRRGFYLVEGNCITCRYGEFYNSTLGSCSCAQGFYRIFGRCGICGGSYDYIPEKQYCKPKCPYNQIYLNQTCVCKPGYTIIEGVCESVCEHNEVFTIIDKECVCRPGYKIIKGKCGICNYYNETYNPSTQSCDPKCGFRQFLIDGRCQKCCTQPKECEDDEVFDPITQSCQPKCGQFEIFSNRQCICSQGYNLIDGKCGNISL